MVDDKRKKIINADKDVVCNGSDYEGKYGDDDDVDDKDNDCHHDQGKEDNDEC